MSEHATKPSGSGIIMKEEEGEVMSPACPYCRITPVILRVVTEVQPPYIVGIVCCGNSQCRKVFNVQILGNSPDQNTPRIHKPH